MPSKETNIKSGLRELWGLALFTAGILMVLAIVSYQSNDISSVKTPPNDPPLNYIGPVGAWYVYLSLMAFGLGALLIPVYCVWIGILLMLRSEEIIRTWLIWGAIVIVSACGLFTVHAQSWQTLCAHFNIGGLSGGLSGWLIADQFLKALFGYTGATVILTALIAASLVMCVGPVRLKYFALRLLALGAALKKSMAAILEARRDRLEKIIIEEREIARKRAALEKAVRREKLIIPEEPPSQETLAIEIPEAETSVPVEKKTALPEKKRREQLREPEEPPPVSGKVLPAAEYQLPPLDILKPLPDDKDRKIFGDQQTTAKILQETLAEFGIQCEVKHIEQGPVVTRYELLPAAGVRVEKIGQLSNNIALTLKATSIRVQAPIPGKGVVGIEVPNSLAMKVYLREILEGESWRNSKAEIPIILGKDIGGNDIIPDLTGMPHLLIAGATGSGKTVCMNSILAGLLMSRTPAQLRLMLIDPKLIEFAVYNDLPHLIVPVITDPKKVAFGLRWAINEMEKRYKLFARTGVRNIQGYNSRPLEPGSVPSGNDAEDEEIPKRLPYLVIVIDELADLMMVAQADVENHIARLAQLSRAVGIHMILATQRPSVNIITGTIKANFPARISFQVAQKVDSRTIIDAAGADKLLGRGDMLFMQPTTSKLLRAQGAMTDDEDIQAIVDYIKKRYPPSYEVAIKQHIEKAAGSMGDLEDDAVDDDLLEAAIEIIRETRRASVSLLQRRMKIGYNRAGRLMDKLEEKGIVGPVHGSDPREILIDLDAQSDSNVSEQQEET
jgi:S-DNA-T family DNA segregation ATPase FtsK/SpoIIIE